MQNRFPGDMSGDLSSGSLGGSSSTNWRNNNARTVGQGYQPGILMAIIGVGLIGGIGSRLGYLQLSQGTKNRQIAEHNRVRTVAKAPVRGNMYDRNGVLLAGSKLSHSVFVWPLAGKRENWPATRRRVAEILNLSEDEIQTAVAKVSINSTKRVRIARDLTEGQITALGEYAADREGVDVDVESVRYYPGGELAAHVLG